MFRQTPCWDELLPQTELGALAEVFPLEPFILDGSVAVHGLIVLGTGIVDDSNLELIETVTPAPSDDSSMDPGTEACMLSDDGSFGATSKLDCTPSCGCLSSMSIKDSLIATMIICIQAKYRYPIRPSPSIKPFSS